MASPFQKYQSEQVQQIAPGFVEAYGRAGASIGQGIAQIGANVAKGLEIADENRKKEIATKAALAPYIRNDDRIVVTEGLLKSGVFTKADDGTVAVSAPYAGKVDMKGLNKYLSFYNETGGDGSKLSGDKLLEFASRFEGEQKYIAQQASNAEKKTETELKLAQIAKLKAEAAAKANETGLVASILGGTAAPTVNTSPTAGIDLTPYTLGGGKNNITPYVPATTPAAAPVTKVDTTTPGVAAPAATAPAAEPTVSPALTAGTAPAAAAAAATNEPVVSPALTAGTSGTPATPAATAEPAPAPAAAAPAAAPDIVDELAAEAGLSRESLIESAKSSGVTPQAYVGNLRSIAKANGQQWPVGQPAAEPTPAPAPTERVTAAGTVVPEKYDVPAEAAAVADRITKIGQERTSIREKYSADRTRIENEIAKNRSKVLALSVINPQKGSALASYNENLLKFVNEAEARELKAVDEKEAEVNRNFANYQAAAAAQRSASVEARAGRAEERAVRKETADIKKAEADAAAASEKAAQVLADRKKKQLIEYPSYGVWTHRGARMGNDPKTGKPYDPSDFDIRPLTVQAQNAVNEAVEGWNKSTDFLINLDTTLKNRVAGDEGWKGRFRLTAGNMKNYFEGELASVFGVATLRRAIVSGGNFSDADREFVKSAITYINTAALDLSPADLDASLSALAVFVNGLYERTLETNDMGYDPEAAKAQAKKLEDFGFTSKANSIKKGIDRAGLFYSRFGIKPPGGNSPSVSQEKLKAAFDVLYPKLKAKGLLPEGMKAN